MKKRLILAGLGGFLVLVGFVHSPALMKWTGSFLRSWLADKFHQDLAWADISWGFGFHYLEFKDLIWFNPGSPEPYLEARRIRLELHWWKFSYPNLVAHVTVEQPRIHIQVGKHVNLGVTGERSGSSVSGAPSWPIPPITIIGSFFQSGDAEQRWKLTITDAGFDLSPGPKDEQRILSGHFRWTVKAGRDFTLEGRAHTQGDYDPLRGIFLNLSASAQDAGRLSAEIQSDVTFQEISWKIHTMFKPSFYQQLELPSSVGKVWDWLGIPSPESKVWKMTLSGKWKSKSFNFELSVYPGDDQGLRSRCEGYWPDSASCHGWIKGTRMNARGDFDLQRKEGSLKCSLRGETDGYTPELPSVDLWPHSFHGVTDATLTIDLDSRSIKMGQGHLLIRAEGSPRVGLPIFLSTQWNMNERNRINFKGHLRDTKASFMEFRGGVDLGSPGSLASCAFSLQPHQFPDAWIERIKERVPEFTFGDQKGSFSYQRYNAYGQLEGSLQGFIAYHERQFHDSFQARLIFPSSDRWGWSLILSLDEPGTLGKMEVSWDGIGKQLPYADWKFRIAMDQFSIPAQDLPQPLQEWIENLRVDHLEGSGAGYGLNLRNAQFMLRGASSLTKAIQEKSGWPFPLTWNVEIAGKTLYEWSFISNLHSGPLNLQGEGKFYYPQAKLAARLELSSKEAAVRNLSWSSMLLEADLESIRRSVRMNVGGRVTAIRWRDVHLGNLNAQGSSTGLGTASPEIHFKFNMPNLSLQGETTFMGGPNRRQIDWLVKTDVQGFTWNTWGMTLGGESSGRLILNREGLGISHAIWYIERFEVQHDRRVLARLNGSMRGLIEKDKLRQEPAIFQLLGQNFHIGSSEDRFKITGTLDPTNLALTWVSESWSSRLQIPSWAGQIGVEVEIPWKNPKDAGWVMRMDSLYGPADLTLEKSCSLSWLGPEQRFFMNPCRFVHPNPGASPETWTISASGTLDSGLQLDVDMVDVDILRWAELVTSKTIRTSDDDYGRASAHLQLSLPNPRKIPAEFSLSLDMDKVDLQTEFTTLTLSEPLHWMWDSHGLSLDFRPLRVNDQSIPLLLHVKTPEPLSFGQWLNPNEFRRMNLDLQWDGTMNLGAFFIPFGVFFEGELAGRLMIEGPGAHPLIVGRLNLENGRYWYPEWEIGMEPITADLEILGIESIVADIRGGGFSGSWQARFHGGWNSRSKQWDWREFRVSSPGLEVFSPQGWRLVLSGILHLDTKAQPVTIRGDVKIHDFDYFAPVAWSEWLKTENIDENALWRRFLVLLDVQVEVQDTRFVNSLASIEGKGRLMLRGDWRNPRIEGTWRNTNPGFLQFRALGYQMKTVEFQWSTQRPFDEPTLHMILETAIDPMELSGQVFQVRVELTGTPSEPVVHLSSEPPLGEQEILAIISTGSLIVGRNVGEENVHLAAADVGRAMAYSVGGAVSSTLLKPLTSLLGGTEISVHPVLQPLQGGTDLDPTGRLNLRHQILPWASSIFSMNLRNTGQQAWIFDLQPVSWSLLRILRNIDQNRADWTLGVRGQLSLPWKTLPSPWLFRKPSPQRFNIIDVKVEEGGPWSRNVLMKLVGVHPHHHVDPFALGHRVREIENKLRAMGFWSGTIRWSLQRNGPAGYTLILTVSPGPMFVGVKGLGVPEWISIHDVNKSLRPCFVASMPHALKLFCARLNFREYLEQRGYFVQQPEVNPISDTDGITRVVVSVKNLKPIHGYKVQWFEGAWPVHPDRRKTLMGLCRQGLRLYPGTPDEWILWRKWSDCLESWKIWFRNRGFRIDRLAVERKVDTKNLLVNIKIFIEVELPKIRDIAVEGLPQDFPHQNIQVLKTRLLNSFYDVTYVDEDVQRICADLSERGYTRAQCTAKWHPETGHLEVRIRPGDPYRIREVVWGDSFLKRWGPRLTGLRPGRPWSPSLQQHLYQALRNQGIYRNIHVATSPLDREKDLKITVSAEPEPFTQTLLGARYNTTNGFEYELFSQFTEPWLFGARLLVGIQSSRPSSSRSEKDFSEMTQSKDRLYRVGFALPHLWALPVVTQIYYLDEHRKDRVTRTDIDPLTGKPLDPTLFPPHVSTFVTDEKSWTLEQIWNLRPSLTWSYRITPKTIHIFDVPEESSPCPLDPIFCIPLDLRFRIVRLSTSLQWDLRNDPLDPTSGHLELLTLEYAPSFLGSEIPFIKGFLQVSQFQPLVKNRLILASGLRIGVAHSFEGPLLGSERFFAGGPTTFRGLGFNELSPIDPFTGVRSGGDAMFVVNEELRLRLFGSLWGAAFFDMAGVFPQLKDFSLRFRDLREAVGLGIRYRSPLGVIRLDWGHLLDPVGNERRSRVFFTFGQVF